MKIISNAELLPSLDLGVRKDSVLASVYKDHKRYPTIFIKFSPWLFQMSFCTLHCCEAPPLITREGVMERDDIKSTNRDICQSQHHHIGFIIRGSGPLCCQSTPSISIRDKIVKHHCKTLFIHTARYKQYTVCITSLSP